MTRQLSLSLFLGLAACAGAPDADEDGLVDSFEEAIGTSSELADSDGDGVDDLTEHFGFYRADDRDDFPRQVGLPRFPPPDNDRWDELSADESWDQGEFSNTWEAESQYGELFDLREFFGSVIMIDIGAEWCAPCREAAETIEDEYQDRRERGFLVVQLLLDGETPDEEPNVERWIDTFDMTFPVLGDHQQTLAQHYILPDEQGGFNIPNFTIIGRDFTIESLYGTEDWDLIDELLDEDPPEIDWPMPEDWETIRDERGMEMMAVPYGFRIIESGAGSASSGGGWTSGAPWGGVDTTD